MANSVQQARGVECFAVLLRRLDEWSCHSHGSWVLKVPFEKQTSESKYSLVTEFVPFLNDIFKHSCSLLVTRLPSIPKPSTSLVKKGGNPYVKESLLKIIPLWREDRVEFSWATDAAANDLWHTRRGYVTLGEIESV